MPTGIDALHATADLVARHLRRYAEVCAAHPEITAEQALRDAAADVEDTMLGLIACYERRQTA